jgi:hypothetical protein
MKYDLYILYIILLHSLLPNLHIVDAYYFMRVECRAFYDHI